MSEKKQIHFKMPELKSGIVKFDVSVEAESNEEAVRKLAHYLIELRRGFVRASAPLTGSHDPAKIGKELIWRVNQCTDPTSFVLTVHLFCEYWLNLILRKYCSNRDLSRLRSFALKLDIAFGIGKLPETVFENLQKLNRLRNDIAHNLDFDFTSMDLAYHPAFDDFEPRDYKPAFGAMADQHNIFNVLSVALVGTYFLLHNHCVQELGFTGGEMFSETIRPSSSAE